MITTWLASCAANPGPKGWLPSPKEALFDAYGAWMIVESSLKFDPHTIEGELIAIDQEKVFLLTEFGLKQILKHNVIHVTFAVYKEKRIVPYLAILGLLSTASHGYLAFISVPLWLITGISSSIAESTSGTARSEHVDWEEIRKYARFPQGLPPGLDLLKLKQKTYK